MGPVKATLHRYAAAIGRRLLALAGRLLGERLPPLLLRGAMVSASLSVRETLRFAGRELFSRHCVGVYRLRRSGRTLSVRHPASDAWVVYEVVRRGVYLPPPEVERAIRTRTDSPRIVDLGAHVGSASLLLLERFPGGARGGGRAEPGQRRAASADDRAQRPRRAVRSPSRSRRAPRRAPRRSRDSRSSRTSSARAPPRRSTTSRTCADSSTTHPPAPTAGRGCRCVRPARWDADLVKMDIEGAEWPILQDPRFAELADLGARARVPPAGIP